jgi:hypothetical protein
MQNFVCMISNAHLLFATWSTIPWLRIDKQAGVVLVLKQKYFHCEKSSTYTPFMTLISAKKLICIIFSLYNFLLNRNNRNKKIRIFIIIWVKE